MKVRVSAINFAVILSCSYCLSTHLFSGNDYDVQPESATFGITSRHDEFPFMTALGWRNNETDEVEFLCGGMLISPTFVLTAAHCLFFDGKLPNLIRIGGNQLNSTYNEEHSLRNYFIHPWYNELQAYDDIALIQLSRPSEYYSVKQPICLWARPDLKTSEVTAIGYGATKFAGLMSPSLQKVKLFIVSTRICRVYHERKRKFPFGITDDHLCAGDPGGRQDTCQGDSGGPLIVSSDEENYAVGIISNGQACFGFPPAIYTKVSSYLKWITNIFRRFRNSRFRICY